MRRTEREIRDEAIIEEILRRATVAYLGLCDRGETYVVPMNFGYAAGCLYAHSAESGRKIEMLKRNPRVAFTVVQDQVVVPGEIACRWSSRYRSVMGVGTASFVEDPAERRRALDCLLGKFTPGPYRYDEAALARTAVIRIAIESRTGKESGYSQSAPARGGRIDGGLPYYKYHALGNDDLVLDPREVPRAPDPDRIRRLCDRHYGIGADGILWGPAIDPSGAFALRIFNPDGSEAEKSGNGLRIFARYLWDRGRVGQEPFAIETPGGRVRARVAPDGRSVTVEMGIARFDSERIPMTGPPREVIGETLEVSGRTFRFCGVTVGNPHCVILDSAATREEACRYGPSIETDARFPRRTNVQFLHVMDRRALRIEIWERGAGYTLASGTSACAAAAAARRLGLCDEAVEVRMPGGTLEVRIGPDYDLTLTGPVTRVAEGVLDPEA